MKIKKEIEVEVEKDGSNIICRDLTTLQMVMGIHSISGNLHLYEIKKQGQSYIVPLKQIKDRIKILEQRKNKLNDFLHIMYQVVRKEK